MPQAPEELAERLRQVRQELEQAGRRLLTPNAEALEAACGDLERAGACLDQLVVACRSELADGRAALRASLAPLRRQLQQLGVLLEQAGAFQLGWARLLGAMVGGYTRQGEPAPLQAAPSVSLEG